MQWEIRAAVVLGASSAVYPCRYTSGACQGLARRGRVAPATCAAPPASKKVTNPHPMLPPTPCREHTLPLPCHACVRYVFLTVPCVRKLAATAPFSSRSIPSPHPQHPHPHVEPVGYPSFPVGKVWNQLCSYPFLVDQPQSASCPWFVRPS